jgi:hypothetical protein
LRFSVLGFAAAVAVHAATFAGQVPGWAGVALFLAVFPVLYFSVRAFGREARKRQAQEGGTGLSILFREAPSWLVIGALVLLAYAVLCMVTFTSGKGAAMDREEENLAVRTISGLLLFAFAWSAATAAAALRIAWGRYAETERMGLDRWRESAMTSLILSLRSMQLNGLRCSDPHDRLRDIGRPDNADPLGDGRFEYRSLGLFIVPEKGRIDYVAFLMGDPGEPRFGSCRLLLEIESGAQVPFDRSTTIADAIAVLGQPQRKDEDGGGHGGGDEGETVLYYLRESHELELEFGSDGRLRRVNLYESEDGPRGEPPPG